MSEVLQNVFKQRAKTVMHICMETDKQSSMFTVNHESFKITRFIVTN